MKNGKQIIIIGVITFTLIASMLLVFGTTTSGTAAASSSLFSSPVSSLSLESSSPSVGWSLPHHSIPTKMSLQGKVTDFNSVPVADGNLGVKISDVNSCSTSVFYDYTFPHAIQAGFFNILLGQNENLPLNYNQDYFMCLYVNGQQLSGPQVFRGGQGEVHTEQLADGNSTNPFDFNYVKAIEYTCNASTYGGCLNIPSNTYAFKVSGAGETGMDFNSTGRFIGLLNSGVVTWAFGLSGNSNGIGYQFPKTTDFPTWTGTPATKNGAFYMYDTGTKTYPRYFSNGSWHYYGEEINGDQNVLGSIVVDQNIYPDVNGTGEIGNNGKRWLEIWGIKIHSGDLIFSNGMYFKEPDDSTVCLYTRDDRLLSCYNQNGITNYVPVIEKESIGPEPPCTPENEGMKWFAKGMPGIGTRYEMCVRTAQEQFAWTPLI